jgi:hypothetical protein
MARSAWVVLLALCATCAACPSAKKDGHAPAAGPPKEITIFFSAELRGEIEPCGCNSNPLGDIARIAAIMEDARAKRPTVWLDGGSTLYSEVPLGESKKDQERMKMLLLSEQLPKLGLAVAGIGPYDLADGKDGVRLVRVASNVDATGLPVEDPKLLDVGGVKLGVFGVVAPDALDGQGIKAGDPTEAARGAVKTLRAQGAQVVVALAYMAKGDAKKLARQVPGIDFVLVGRDAPDPEPRKTPHPFEAVEGVSTLLVQPFQRGQSLVRVDLTVDAAGGPFVDAIGEERAKARVEDIDREAAELREKLDAWAKDPSADKAFVAQKQKELDALEAEKKDLAARPLRKPEKGSWFTASHVLVVRALRCDVAVVKAKHDFVERAGKINLEHAKDEKPPAVAAGKAGYVGREECVFCHKKEAELWATTKHAHAFETLEQVGKQYDRECISCHVTGWLEPGGAVLTTETLRDVQCEVCHGPGSLHVDADGKALDTIVRKPPETRCVKCHQPEHSDTFDYTAYLRDVTGKGHGEKLRASLGDGPTGHELRGAALEKAGKSVGEGCER